MSLCRPSRCGCTLTSATLSIGALAGGVGWNVESYEGTATESPDTRPGVGERLDGMRIFTIDTRRIWMWDNDLNDWVILHEPWQDATPTLTNATLGTGGSNDQQYKRSLDSITVQGRLRLGTGGDVTGSLGISLPAANDWGTYSLGVAQPASGATPYVGVCYVSATSSTLNFSVSTGVVGTTIPFDWTNGAVLYYSIEYRIAP